jgi:hypothetical protein
MCKKNTERFRNMLILNNHDNPFQLRHLSHQSIQAPLLRNTYQSQIRHAHRYQGTKHAYCAPTDLRQSLCGIWYVFFQSPIQTLCKARCVCVCVCVNWQVTKMVSTVVKNPLSPVEHPGGFGVNNELFEESLEQFVVRSQ